MKFKNLLLSFALLSFLSACSEAPTPVEGKQYQLLPETLNSEKFAPITEVFSLTCGHCRAMEDIIPELQKAVGQDINKMHITFNQSAYNAAIFYYAAEMQLRKTPDHQFMIELFETIQMPNESSAEQKEIAMNNVFESRGLVSPFNYNEQQTEVLFQRLEEISILSEQSKINSVPTFIIKGKYQLITSGHDTTEKMATTIKYLLEK
ncbi:thioredoxin domain-containing protein [Psychromonas hadalis]|uniref:thioredoxin domain-containing protein n=1 Tax=Psychromonas hadalis TaxID=211669 RepID=UPI0003B3FB1A|nr:thioredoxin domain-containing protein [Psychromonas hadalis]